ncbi:MAG: endonuclease [Gelidibacter sp.]
MSLQSPNPDIYTVAFYNTENLFDYINGPLTNEVGLLETSTKRWHKERYENKIYKIGMAISKIGSEDLQKPPALIGLAEVENDRVLTDLIKSTYLEDYNYGFVHFNSPDERGIDVAMLYDKDCFTLENSEAIVLPIESEFGVKGNTRDILKVSGYLKDEKIHVLVNHWPSRHEQSDRTGHNRMFAAQKIVELINEILTDDANAKVIIMGDFNDNPKNNSIQFLKNEAALFNPMEKLMSYKRGSFNHNSKWMLFDQILMTTNFLEPQQKGLKFLKADIFDETFLTQNYGNSKGQPYRTYEGKRYLGGFSDHFPVYIQLKK